MKLMLLSQQKVINFLVENAKQNGNPPTDTIKKEISKVENYNSMISKPTPVAKKKPRKGSQPKQHAAYASSSDSSSDSNESLKNHQKILGKEVKHQALINMKTDKNKEVYE